MKKILASLLAITVCSTSILISTVNAVGDDTDPISEGPLEVPTEVISEGPIEIATEPISEGPIEIPTDPTESIEITPISVLELPEIENPHYTDDGKVYNYNIYDLFDIEFGATGDFYIPDVTVENIVPKEGEKAWRQQVEYSNGETVIYVSLKPEYLSIDMPDAVDRSIKKLPYYGVEDRKKYAVDVIREATISNRYIRRIGINAFQNLNYIRYKFGVDATEYETVVNGEKVKYIMSDEPIDVRIGSYVETIGNDAFRNVKLRNLVIPSHVFKIGDYAFCNTGLNMETVRLGSSIMEVGVGAFKDNNISTVYIVPYYNMVQERIGTHTVYEIGDSVVSDFAFANNPNLCDIVIGSNVSKIGYCAFKGCKSIETVHYGGNANTVKNIRVAYGNANFKKADIIYDTLDPESEWYFKSDIVGVLNENILKQAVRLNENGSQEYAVDRFTWGVDNSIITNGDIAVNQVDFSDEQKEKILSVFNKNERQLNSLQSGVNGQISGYCYGLSALSCLDHYSKQFPSLKIPAACYFKSKDNNLNSIYNVEENREKLKELSLLQCNDVIYSALLKTSKTTDYKLSKMINAIKQNKFVPISLRIDEMTANSIDNVYVSYANPFVEPMYHMVVAYDAQVNTDKDSDYSNQEYWNTNSGYWEVYGKQYDTRILIYDSNLNRDDASDSIYYNSKTNESIVPLYSKPGVFGKDAANKYYRAKVNGIIESIYDLNYKTPLEGVKTSGKYVFTRQSGDIDNDGDVNIFDLITLQKYILCCDSKVNADSWDYADMNADGDVDIFDLGILKNRIVLDKEE